MVSVVLSTPKKDLNFILNYYFLRVHTPCIFRAEVKIIDTHVSIYIYIYIRNESICYIYTQKFLYMVPTEGKQ